jgi:hypothetical protein
MAKPFKLLKTAIGLDDTLDFGKYQSTGLTVQDILKEDPDYIRWIMNNMEKYFYESVHEELERSKSTRKIGWGKHKSSVYTDEYHNVFSDQDDWFEDIPF